MDELLRYNRLDLNLLVALDAILAEGSITRAAAKLGLSQSAMSSALKRLRDFFDDPLFVQLGRQTIPTPLAAELSGPIRSILLEVQSNIIQRQPFDPMSSHRSFAIAASDYFTKIVMSKILRQLEVIAPNIQIELWPMSGKQTLQKINRGEIDFLFCPDYYLFPDLPREVLFKEQFVAISCINNSRFEGPISQKSFESVGHIAPLFGQSRMPGLDETFLQKAGVKRRIEITVGGFDYIPSLIEGTQRIAMIQRRLAEQVVALNRITMHELEFKLSDIHEAMQWQSFNNFDPAHVWFRKLISRTIANDI